MDKEFDSVFDTEVAYDTIFDRADDGDIIDMVSGVTESESCPECEEFEKTHLTADDATPDDFVDVVGKETDNVNSDAEGTDSDALIDIADKDAKIKDGEDPNNGYPSANGVEGDSEADKYYDTVDDHGTDIVDTSYEEASKILEDYTEEDELGALEEPEEELKDEENDGLSESVLDHLLEDFDDCETCDDVARKGIEPDEEADVALPAEDDEDESEDIGDLDLIDYVSDECTR